jgi:hypothetical protein
VRKWDDVVVTGLAGQRSGRVWGRRGGVDGNGVGRVAGGEEGALEDGVGGRASNLDAGGGLGSGSLWRPLVVALHGDLPRTHGLVEARVGISDILCGGARLEVGRRNLARHGLPLVVRHGVTGDPGGNLGRCESRSTSTLPGKCRGRGPGRNYGVGPAPLPSRLKLALSAVPKTDNAASGPSNHARRKKQAKDATRKWTDNWRTQTQAEVQALG